jgi:two-component system, OmpR family, sensor kinase
VEGRHAGSHSSVAGPFVTGVQGQAARRRLALPRSPAGLPLWLKLAGAGLCLSGAAAGAITVAGISLFRASVMRQVDQQVQSDAQRLIGHPLVAWSAPQPAGGLAKIGVEVLGPAGKRLIPVGPDGGTGPAIPTSAGWISAHAGRPVTVPAPGGAASWRVVVEPVRYQARHLLFAYGADDFSVVVTSRATPGVPGTLVVGMGLGGIARSAAKLAVAGLAVGGAVMVLLAALCAAVIRASLRPLAEIGESARAVAQDRPPQRIAGRAPGGEVRSIARSLNRALSHAGEAARAHAAGETAARRSEERLCQGLADAGHDLLAPLSVIAGSAEHYRQRGPAGAGELDHMMKRIADETARMDAVVSLLSEAAAR